MESQRPGGIEAVLDEMLRETFPASDALQLDGLTLDGAPVSKQPPGPTGRQLGKNRAAHAQLLPAEGSAGSLD